MEVINIMLEFLGLTDMTFNNFGEFLPWFATLCLAVFIIATIIRCFFITAGKFERGLR